MTFRALFDHIDACPQCNHVSLDLCDEGKRIRDAAGERVTTLTSAGPTPTSEHAEPS
jgi:hypothetical protein